MTHKHITTHQYRTTHKYIVTHQGNLRVSRHIGLANSPNLKPVSLARSLALGISLSRSLALSLTLSCTLCMPHSMLRFRVQGQV